jgi:hypothetical protein
MKIQLKAIVSTCIVTLVLFSGCKKAEAGPKGDKGDTGAAGMAGNANVKSSTFTNVTWNYNSASSAFETIISYTAITQEIVNNGAVFVYLGNSTGGYGQLPFSQMIDETVILFFDYEFFTGGVKIIMQNSDLDNSYVPLSTAKFKIVAIAGSAKPLKSAENENITFSKEELVN